MHSLLDLVPRCTAFTLHTLKEVHERTIAELQTSGATRLVKALQMVQLQKVIFSIGMFSMFESMLQDRLDCKDGFREAHEILQQGGETDLDERFSDLERAVNVLKHGRGRSYDLLVAKAATLPFRLKLPDEAFFAEGDVSEVTTLVEVDEKFVTSCAEMIGDVCAAIRKARPGTYL